MSLIWCVYKLVMVCLQDTETGCDKILAISNVTVGWTILVSFTVSQEPDATSCILARLPDCAEEPGKAAVEGGPLSAACKSNPVARQPPGLLLTASEIAGRKNYASSSLQQQSPQTFDKGWRVVCCCIVNHLELFHIILCISAYITMFL